MRLGVRIPSTVLNYKGRIMIDIKEWREFRDFLRDTRLTGKQIKYIGKKNVVSLFVTGVPVLGEKIFVGNDIVLLPKSFVNRTHLLTSFAIDGVPVSKVLGE